MISEDRILHYKGLLGRFLSSEEGLDREAVLLEVDVFAQDLLTLPVDLDDMLALHSQAKARLTAHWRECGPDTVQGQNLLRMASGDDLPVMLALVLPVQVQERLAAERRWSAEHARLSAVFEQTDDLVLMFDSEGRIEYLNPAFSHATGYPLAFARTEPAKIWSLGLAKDGTTYLEAELTCADGRMLPTAWSVSAVCDADGRLLNHVCIGRDISAQRRFDDALQQNDRLRAVATLAAGIAHDFNNLLGSIQGLTEVCQAQVEGGSRMARNLAGIHRASQRAAELVVQLLGFAREQRSEQQPLDLVAWLDGAQDILVAALPRNVQLRIRRIGPLQVQADPSQLEQVVLNLVKNAGYAMRDKGGVVGVQPDHWRDDQDRLWVRLQVIDQGEGIPADVLPRIFDPFFTTKPVGEGTGLGLSAAYGIVRQHKGELRVHSEAGRGTTFTVLLPVDENARSNHAPGPPQAAGAAGVARWNE